MPIWLKVLLFVGIAGVLATGVFSFITESDEEVVQSQINAIQEGKLSEAYYGFTSSEFQKSSSLEEFKGFLKPLLIIINSDSSLESFPLDKDLTVVRAEFDNANNPVILDFRLVKQDGRWKIFNIRLLGKKQENMPDPSANNPDSPVRDFLDLIKNKQINEAYQTTTAKGFKNTITPQVFQDFVDSILIFSDLSSYEIVSTSLEKNLAITQVLIHENGHISHVQFLTLVEDNLWKIRGIEILSSDTVKNLNSYKSADLNKPINAFIDALKKGEVKQAYDSTTTESFREITSLEQLEEFLKTFDFIVNHKKISFYKIAFDNNIAIVNSQFISEQNKTHEVEFYLVQENGEWKIVQIRVLNSSDQSQAVLGKK